MAGKSPQQYPEVTAQAYIVAHQTSDSYVEVAEKTGLSPALCAARASYYRKKLGIELKRYRDDRKKESASIEELDALIVEMGGTPVAARPKGPEKTVEQRQAEERRRKERNAALVAQLLGRKGI